MFLFFDSLFFKQTPQCKILADALKKNTTVKTLRLTEQFFAAPHDEMCHFFLERMSSDIRNLISLDLSKNSLNKLPLPIGEKERENVCERVSDVDVGLLDSLQDLRVSHNLLMKIPPTIGRLSRLHTLDISQNRIQSIPSEIFDLKELVSFDFSNNKIAEIPQYLTLMPKLERITAHHNPAIGIPKGTFWCRSIGKFKNFLFKKSSRWAIGTCVRI